MHIARQYFALADAFSTETGPKRVIFIASAAFVAV
jgi:hypothetical protein